MTNKMERALAYRLAKELSSDDLSEISGGQGEQLRTCHKVTQGGRGSNGEWEVHFDVSVDW